MRSPTRRFLVPLAAIAALAPTFAPMAQARTLDIDGQAQQNSNWCWAATGNSIAAYWGKNVSQNTFCSLAFGRNPNTSCPNSQATLENDQRAFRQLGMKPGTYTHVLNARTVNQEIQAGRPINTRVQWASGGGHMMTIYGYDANSGSLDFYNPWSDDSRYNTATYDWYVSNNDFNWTHSLYGIGGSR